MTEVKADGQRYATWDRELEDAEVELLLQGYSPAYIPRGLKFYANLGDIQELTVNKAEQL